MHDLRAMVPRSVIDEFLAQKSLAVVGVSRSGGGFGNSVRKDLRKKGYEVHVVHPSADAIAGEPCAKSLAEVADRVTGVVLITPPAETEKLVREAAELGIPRVWMQQGAESKDAIAFCREHGIDVVHGECILMFAEPAGWVHRAHRWVRGATGELPR
jgi:predicted CoA-binding protein